MKFRPFLALFGAGFLCAGPEFLRGALEAKKSGKAYIGAKDQAFTYSFENKEAK
jgi:hypothetical protein